MIKFLLNGEIKRFSLAYVFCPHLCNLAIPGNSGLSLFTYFMKNDLFPLVILKSHTIFIVFVIHLKDEMCDYMYTTFAIAIYITTNSLRALLKAQSLICNTLRFLGFQQI